jgi:1,2-diacylglycerol 3-alpha-glucosyltransferase
MRIGMFTDVYKPHVSGITNYISLNKKYLEELGHEVFVITFGDEDYQDEEPRVIRSPGMPLLETGYYLSLRYSHEARQVMRTLDIGHAHHPFLSGTLALRFCKPRGIPLVFTNHTRYDLYAQAYLPVLPNVIGETALEAYLPSFCRSCDLVIAPSPGMREVLQRFGVTSPIEVVPNGVDLAPYRHFVEPIDRAGLGFSDNDILLVYSGRIAPEKNLAFLLRTFSGLSQAYDNVGLLIVGDGPERDNLQDRVNLMGIASRVCFTGMVPYTEVPRYLAASDAFVTASVTEVHPLSVIEAMACGLPVLGIQSPGIGDMIEDGVTGFLIQEEDLAAFTAKMVRMVTEHDLRHTMSQKARQAVEAYAIERTAQMLQESYKQVIHQAAGRYRSFRTRLFRMWDSWTG